MLQMLFSLLCVKYVFCWFYGSFRFDRNNKYAEKVLRQPWNVLTLQLPLSLPRTDKILITLQVYFDRNVSLKFSEYFSQFYTRKQNCRALLLKQVQRSEQK